GQQRNPGCCEFECEWDAIEPTADLHYRLSLRWSEVKAGGLDRCPLDEERARRGVLDVCEVVVLKRELQRLHSVHALVADSQRLAARDEYGQAGARGTELRNHRRRGEHLLEVVEHEQHLLGA